jgi:hypothetical protein
MVEAALPEIPDAITLVLDGDPIPERTAQIFDEVVQRDAAWQTALDRTFTPEAGAHPHDVFYKRGVPPFHFVGFPELLRDVRERREGCRVSCSFDPSRPWDEGRVAAVAEANGGTSAASARGPGRGCARAWATRLCRRCRSFTTYTRSL